MCIAGSSSQSIRCRLAAVARPAQAFKIRILIGTPMCLGYDVIDGCSRYRSTVPQAFLADVVITLEDAGAANSPVVTIAALVPALALLVYLPACVLVLGTVA